MAITTVNQLEAAEERYQRLKFSKPNLSNAVSGQHHSTWLSGDLPAAGAIPGTTPVVPDNTTTGTFNFMQQTAPIKAYISELSFMCRNSFSTIEIHDRLLHMGGLVGNVTTTQNVLMDMNSFLSTNNLDARKGDSDYSDVQWWLEFYSQINVTNSLVTINVTYNDGSTGNLVVSVSTPRFSRLISLNSLIPAADSGKYIRGINTVQFSVSATVAGNFGFTATRYLAGNLLPVSNQSEKIGWTKTGLPEVPGKSCLFLVVVPTTTTTGSVYGDVKIVYG